MYAHYRRTRASVYAQPRLSTRAREMFAETYCFSRLLYSAGVWDALRASEWRPLRTAYMSVQRAIANKQNLRDGEERWTDSQVIVDRQCKTIEQRVMVCRIKYFGRFAAKAPIQLVRLAVLAGDAQRSWLSATSSALQEAWECDDRLHDEMPPPGEGIEQWYQRARLEGRPFVNRCVRGAIKSRRRRTAAYVAIVVATDVVQCYECGATFDSTVALRAHAANQHGYHNPFFERMAGTICVACGCQYHTRSRAIKHLRRRAGESRCAEFYLSKVPPLTKVQLESEKAAESKRQQGNRVKDLLMPPIRVQTPRLV